MKRFIALSIAFMLILSIPALAAVPDLSGCTDAELRQVIDQARNRLFINALHIEKDAMLVDQDGIMLYLTGDYKEWGSSTKYLTLYAVLVNSNSFEASVGFDSCSINGWDIYASGTGSCAGGKRKKVELDFNLSDADITKYSEIEDITFRLYTYNNTAWKTISYIPEQVLMPN